MKAILVMEMPEGCRECPMEMDVEDTSGNNGRVIYAGDAGKGMQIRAKNPIGARWCRCPKKGTVHHTERFTAKGGIWDSTHAWMR